MNTNSSSTNLVIGMAAFGLALVAAGVGLYRRRRAGEAAGSPENEPQAGAGGSEGQHIPEEDLPEGRNAPEKLPAHPPQTKLPLEFFLLVFVITIPFWIFGGKPLPIPIKLPASALAACNPLIAALILTYRREGSTGIKELIKRVLDFRKIKHRAWYLPILFLYPLIAVLSYAVMRLAGRPLPEPQIPWLMAPVLFLVFFIYGTGEELGWMGYAFDPMQNRWGALKASILLGVVWAIYHLIPDLQNQQAADWVLWHRLGTVAFRILIAWAYNNTGKSVFAAILFHVSNNLSWALFPNNGSHYDPSINFLLTLPVLGFVVLGWESKTLARLEHRKLPQDTLFCF